MKKFLLKDKTGRGFTTTLNEDQLPFTIDMDEVEHGEDETPGEVIEGFIESAMIGDELETRTQKVTRIK